MTNFTQKQVDSGVLHFVHRGIVMQSCSLSSYNNNKNNNYYFKPSLLGFQRTKKYDKGYRVVRSQYLHFETDASIETNYN